MGGWKRMSISNHRPLDPPRPQAPDPKLERNEEVDALQARIRRLEADIASKKCKEFKLTVRECVKEGLCTCKYSALLRRTG